MDRHPHLVAARAGEAEPLEEEAREDVFGIRLYLDKAEKIRTYLDFIDRLGAISKEKYKKLYFCYNKKDEDILERQLNDIADAANVNIRKTKAFLNESKSDLDLLRTEVTQQTKSDFRIRETMHGIYSRRFVTTLRRFQSIQQKYRRKTEERVKRQFLLAKPEATQEELKLAKEGKINMYAAMDTEAAKTKLRRAEKRKEDMKEIETGIKQLAELYAELQTIIAAQDNVLVKIEDNFDTAIEYVDEARRTIQETSEQVPTGCFPC
ncbi:MAG: t-SNARE complex subunit, syntaxin [Amphiamblys sp. WSBS2006]|nr:MAG: t-SNARE complex subunit, syntaxin [Amphiamblys sp. WSBS2006]